MARLLFPQCLDQRPAALVARLVLVQIELRECREHLERVGNRPAALVVEVDILLVLLVIEVVEEEEQDVP